jgi:hypothetical protein
LAELVTSASADSFSIIARILSVSMSLMCLIWTLFPLPISVTGATIIGVMQLTVQTFPDYFTKGKRMPREVPDNLKQVTAEFSAKMVSGGVGPF